MRPVVSTSMSPESFSSGLSEWGDDRKDSRGAAASAALLRSVEVSDGWLTDRRELGCAVWNGLWHTCPLC